MKTTTQISSAAPLALCLASMLASEQFSHAGGFHPLAQNAPTLTLEERARVQHPESKLTFNGKEYLKLAHETVVLSVVTAPQSIATVEVSTKQNATLALRILVDGKELEHTNSLSGQAKLVVNLARGDATIEISSIPEFLQLTEGKISPEATITNRTVSFSVQVEAQPLILETKIEDSQTLTSPSPSALPNWRFRNEPLAESPLTLPHLPKAKLPTTLPTLPPTDRFGNRYYDGGRTVIGPGVNNIGNIHNNGGTVRIGTIQY